VLRPALPSPRLLLAGAAASLVLAAPAGAATIKVASPDGRIVASVRMVHGAPSLSARLGGSPLLAATRLGVQLQGADLRSGLALRHVTRRRVREAVHTVTGPRRSRTYRAGEALLTLHGARTLRLRVRVSDDGVAYRYEVPGAGTKELGEAGGFAPVAVRKVWSAAHRPDGESLWGQGPWSGAGAQGQTLPTELLRVGPGDRYVLVTEAGVDGRNAASRLVRDGATLRYGLARQGQTTTNGPVEHGDPLPVEMGENWSSPWRVAIAGRLGTVTVSTLVADLARAPKGDFSWVRAGTAAWSWWSENDSPSSLTRQEQYVDFAAKHGWRYVTVDAGWDKLGTGLDALAAYAKARGVHLVLWFIRYQLTDPVQRAKALDRLAALGIAGIKVDFFDDETQPTMRLVDDILAAAAARHLVVDLHGFMVPRGLERTWPNLLSYEGVRGAEYYPIAARNPLISPPTAEHNAILPFTRGVAGPADATPVTFTAPGRRTSDAHELALALVLTTGLLHPADSIDAYAQRPAATAVLDELPATWDASRLVAGDPGRSATIARRHGSTWWVGSVAAGAAHTVHVPLRFLGTGRWRADVTQDAPGPDVATRTRTVRSTTTLTLHVEANGGFVIRLRRAG
jgi:hypothetical protein